MTLARTYKPFGETLDETGTYESAFGFLGAQLDRVSGLLYANGRYYDPATGRYLTPNHNFDPLRPGTLNPYAPQQGPGLWLLLPLVGLVFAWRGRKRGPWRMLVLVCALGMGVMLGGCVTIELVPTPTPEPVQTPLPQPPTAPTSAPTSMQTGMPENTPTSTYTPPPPPPTATATPPPIPCPTPTNTPVPDDDIRITLDEVTQAGSVLAYMKSEPDALVLTRVAMNETINNDERIFVMWIIKKRATMFGTSIKTEIFKSNEETNEYAFAGIGKVAAEDTKAQSSTTNYAFFDPAFTASTNGSPPYTNCNTFSDMLFPCDSNISVFRDIYNQAVNVLSSDISEVPMDLKNYDSFGHSDLACDNVSRGPLSNKQLFEGNYYKDCYTQDNEGGY